jgi:hypothetical protein
MLAAEQRHTCQTGEDTETGFLYGMDSTSTRIQAFDSTQSRHRSPTGIVDLEDLRRDP